MFVVSTKMDRLVSVSLPVAAGEQHRANVRFLVLFGYDGDMKAHGGGARTAACLDLSQPSFSSEVSCLVAEKTARALCKTVVLVQWYWFVCCGLINSFFFSSVRLYQRPLVSHNSPSCLSEGRQTFHRFFLLL